MIQPMVTLREKIVAENESTNITIFEPHSWSTQLNLINLPLLLHFECFKHA